MNYPVFTTSQAYDQLFNHGAGGMPSHIPRAARKAAKPATTKHRDAYWKKQIIEQLKVLPAHVMSCGSGVVYGQKVTLAEYRRAKVQNGGETGLVSFMDLPDEIKEGVFRHVSLAWFVCLALGLGGLVMIEWTGSCWWGI